MITKLEYPAAPTVDAVDDYHGRTVADPYRWMEDLADPRLGPWLGAQAELVEQVLASAACRTRFRERIAELLHVDVLQVPLPAGKRWFQSRQEAGADEQRVYVLDAPDGEPRLIIDPETLGENAGIAEFHPSPDGRLLLYARSVAGSDWRTWHVLDVATRTALPDVVEGAKLWGTWLPDASGFLYITFPGAAGDRDQATNVPQLKLHRLGTPQAADELVFEEPDRPRYFFPRFSDDGRHLVVTFLMGPSQASAIYVAPAPGPWNFREITASDEQLWFAGGLGDTIYVLITEGSPNGRLVAIDLERPEPSNWSTVVPEDPELVLRASAVASICGGQMLTAADSFGQSTIRIHRLDGTGELTVSGTEPGPFAPAFLDQPFVSAGGFAYFQLGSLNAPSTVYRCDLATGHAEPLYPVTGGTRLDVEASLEWAVSEDGTRVPMTVVRDRRAPRRPEPPVILEGYGGAGGIMHPYSFTPWKTAWLELGGVVATAHLRGGGELGSGWWEGGRGAAGKRRAMQDFVACGRWLGANLTSPSKVGITGRSSGAMLASAAVEQDPAAFGALVAEVGMYDPLRYHLYGLGRLMIREYGCSEDRDDFEQLIAYSPLHNVADGTEYPPTILTYHEGDNRVAPGNSFKFLARLQAAQAGSAPVVMRTRSDAGHFGGPAAGEAAEKGDLLAFFALALGAPDCA